jgi:hypothetical protein
MSDERKKYPSGISQGILYTIKAWIGAILRKFPKYRKAFHQSIQVVGSPKYSFYESKTITGRKSFLALFSVILEEDDPFDQAIFKKLMESELE